MAARSGIPAPAAARPSTTCSASVLVFAGVASHRAFEADSVGSNTTTAMIAAAASNIARGSSARATSRARAGAAAYNLLLRSACATTI